MSTYNQMFKQHMVYYSRKKIFYGYTFDTPVKNYTQNGHCQHTSLHILLATYIVRKKLSFYTKLQLCH